MSARERGLRAVALTAVALAASTACSVGLEDLPLPAPGVGGNGYTIHADFANALNLPAKAKVRLAGADVGEVTGMAVRDYTAVVTMSIEQGVVLPLGTRAELRTATPLGDVFVSLTAPVDATPATPALRDGDSIARDATAAAATIEELLTTAALLVNGGAIRDLTALVNGLGQAVGDRGDRVGALIAQSTRVVQALAARSEDIRTTLVQIDQLTQRLHVQRGTIDEVISAAGPALTTLQDNASRALALVRRVDQISRQLEKFPGLNGAATTGMVADINRIAAGLDAAATDPNASVAAMNALLGPVIAVTSSTSASVDADMRDLALGVFPDPNHPGDPHSRVPDARDWEAFAGSLTYTLLKLQQRVTGGGR
ncbi:MlaD family protein [Nocardia implantans]|uniref:MlaD family protein n=1 Tax=Nocardia implantans TaxID=3108168 RepID=A0ABU6AV89_9NOCA|nr:MULTISPECIES: MlaD family protein [unclassified Nocardia]MBF6192395.1 MCE family protein [Nocardia beijingensis]MEA3527702.1 MlaD family protein [Nocardia sp. CDC192]MEB3511410.1 MlaD family protein [Nocardia sp. CDC186]